MDLECFTIIREAQRAPRTIKKLCIFGLMAFLSTETLGNTICPIYVTRCYLTLLQSPTMGFPLYLIPYMEGTLIFSSSVSMAHPPPNPRGVPSPLTALTYNINFSGIILVGRHFIFMWFDIFSIDLMKWPQYKGYESLSVIKIGNFTLLSTSFGVI